MSLVNEPCKCGEVKCSTVVKCRVLKCRVVKRGVIFIKMWCCKIQCCKMWRCKIDSKKIPNRFHRKSNMSPMRQDPMKSPKQQNKKKPKVRAAYPLPKPSRPRWHNGLGNHLAQSETEGGQLGPARPLTTVKLLLIPEAQDLDNGSWRLATRVGYRLHKIFGRRMPCSMYSSLLVEQAGCGGGRMRRLVKCDA